MMADEIDQLAAMLNHTYVDIPELVALGASLLDDQQHWLEHIGSPLGQPPPHSRHSVMSACEA